MAIPGSQGDLEERVGNARTVLGDVPAETLGRVDAHEHVLVGGGMPAFKVPDFRLDSVDKAVEEITSFTRAGGKTLVDMMPIDAGRDPVGLVEVALRTDTNIIASTGFHKEEFYVPWHWRHRYSEDQLADLLVADIEQGMDRHSYTGPIVERVEARAGVIKIATDYHVISPGAAKAIRAAAQAHRWTGAPINTHTEMGTMGREQADMLIDLGVAPEHIIIGHLDRNPDLYVHREIAARGVFLEYDGPSRVKYFPDNVIVDLICAMIDAGHGSRLLLGGDMARRSYLRVYGGGPGLDYILTRFVPRLQAAGISPEAIDAILIHNPARALALRRLTSSR